MDPLTILAGLKTGLAAGKTVASLSKEIGNFFDATDAAKKKLQKKGVGSSDVNSVALDRWAKEREAAQAEEELAQLAENQTGNDSERLDAESLSILNRLVERGEELAALGR